MVHHLSYHLNTTYHPLHYTLIFQCSCSFICWSYLPVPILVRSILVRYSTNSNVSRIQYGLIYYYDSALCDRIRSVIFLVSIFSIISYFIEIILKATNAGETATMLTQLFPATAMNIGVRNIVYLEVCLLLFTM